MKNLFFVLLLSIALTNSGQAQSTIIDFTQYDCNGQFHNLYSELDSGYVVVMEFIMTCSSCVLAGHALETIIADLETQYPGKIRFYQFAYSNAYDCSIMTGFKDTNSFQSTVFEENGHMLAAFGGFGMPTIGIVGGSNHGIIYSSVGFTIPDTALISSSLHNYFATISSNPLPASAGFISSFPNPANNYLTVKINQIKKSRINLSIYDLAGKLIDEPLLNFMAINDFNKTIDVSHLSDGIYTLRISIDEKSYFDRIKISH